MSGEEKKPVLMQITVFDPVDDDKVIQEYAVNYSERVIKEWLTRLFVWAILNNKVVELSPLVDTTVRLFNPKPIEAAA